jgi:hypothetical protein
VATATLLYTHYMGRFFGGAGAGACNTLSKLAAAGVSFTPWLSTVNGDAARDFFARSGLEPGARLVHQFSNGNIAL